MDDRSLIYARAAWLLGTALAALLILGCSALSPAISRTAVPSPSGTDMAALSQDELDGAGFTIAHEDPVGHISVDEAMEVAGRQFEYNSDNSIDPFLVRLTSAAQDTISGPGRIVDRPVWILRYTGPDVRLESYTPYMPDSTAGPPKILTRMYVLIDADTGEFLLARWIE